MTKSSFSLALRLLFWNLDQNFLAAILIEIYNVTSPPLVGAAKRLSEPRVTLFYVFVLVNKVSLTVYLYHLFLSSKKAFWKLISEGTRLTILLIGHLPVGGWKLL